MLKISIIDALRALLKRLRFGKRKSTSPSRPSSAREHPQSENPLPEPSVALRDDAGSDSPQSSPDTIRGNASAGRDEHSVEQPGEPINDDHQSPRSITDSANNPPDSYAADSESVLSSFVEDDQALSIPAETEQETADTVDTATPTDNEDHRRFPTKKTQHSEIAEPNQDAGYAESPRERSTAERKPRKIGGRRSAQTLKPRPKPKRSPSSRPELLCRKVPAAGMWEVLLSADDNCLLAAVELEGQRLDLADRQCPVPSLDGCLAVSCQNGQKHDVPLFDGEEPLIFKLRKDWTGDGRRISGITSGYFIAIAPSGWERTGYTPVEPDSCTDAAFRAHYFYSDAATVAEGLDAGFREYDVSSAASRIDLTGQRVFDDSEDGTLFVGVPPVLNLSPDIAWARIGEEAEQGWKGENFEPAEQSLSDALNGREGHFFLRIYDSQPRLRDSTEFRYLRNLKQISVNGMEYKQDTVLLPHSSGYPPTEVRFLGADGTPMSPVTPSETTCVTVRSGVLDVPPHPDADRISCIVGADAQANVVLELPRVWWRMECGHSDADPWRDTPLVMTRQEFRDHAGKNATMSVRSERCRKIRVGFDDELHQRAERTDKEDCISIPLSDFIDYDQIGQRLNDDAHFNIAWDGDAWTGKICPLIRISADPMPEIVSFSVEPATISPGEEAILRWTTRHAEQASIVIDPGVGVVNSDGTCSVSPAKTTNYTLTLAVSGTDDVTRLVTIPVGNLPPPSSDQPTARVRTVRGWRNGKGFSSRELQDAGLTVREAVGWPIPIDRRRRTAHPVNVKTIRRMLNG